MKVLGRIPKNSDISLPSSIRLVMQSELDDSEQKLQTMADLVTTYLDLDEIIK